MAILLYSNGLTEDYKPSGFTFIETELIELFKEYNTIKTSRLIPVLNTWCIYGVAVNPEPIEFNRIASDIVNDAVYSYVLFVHDSEINPDWNATDTILYTSYNQFLIDIKVYINSIAADILTQYQQISETNQSVNFLPQLETLGATPDKRILFGFNPSEQTKEFYEHEEFYRFSQKIYEYIIKNKQTKEPFTIYADKQAVIIVNSANVNVLLNNMLEKFKSKEDYEICSVLNTLMKKWNVPIKAKRKSRKISDTNENGQS